MRSLQAFVLCLYSMSCSAEHKSAYAANMLRPNHPSSKKFIFPVDEVSVLCYNNQAMLNRGVSGAL